MPVAAAAAVVAAAGGAAFAASAAGIIATAVLGTVFSVGLSYAANALFGKKPRQPEFSVTQRERTQLIRSSIEPHRVIYGTAKVSGPLVFAESTGASKEFLHLVIPLAGHEVDAIDDVYIDDEKLPPLDAGGNVTSGRFAGHVRVRKHLGRPEQAADPDLVAECPGWTAEHRGVGIAYLYVRLKFNQDIFGSIPNIAAVVRGRKVFDPRSGTTAWSDNWALCVRDYLTSGFGMAAGADEVHEASFVAAANVCDELIQISREGATQRRYTCNGVVFLDDKPIEIMEQMLSAGAGALIWQGGTYRLYPGAYRTPTITLDRDDLRGPVRFRARMARQELYNRVRGTYVSPAHHWQPTDFPPIVNPLYVAQDNGEEITKDLDLPFTTDTVTAQRIAKIHLEKARQGITVELQCKMTAFQVEVMKPIRLTLPEAGWQEKVFLPIDWKLSPDGGVDLVLQEEAAAVYDWNFGAAQTYDPAPDTSLPSAFVVPAPTGVGVTPTADVLADGTTHPALLVTWTAPANVFVLEYEVQWRRLSAPAEPDWNSAITRQPRYTVVPVRIGAQYAIRVRAVNHIGVRSAWAEAQPATAIADTRAPGAPTGLTASAGARQIALRWVSPGDPDIKHFEVWENSVDNRGTAYKQAEAFSDYYIRTGLMPNERRWFWVRAVDRSGNVGPFNATAGTQGTASPLIADDIANGIVNTAKFASGIRPVEIVGALPTTGNFQGRIVLLTTDNKLYRYTGTAWTRQVDGRDIGDGTIVYGKLSAGAVRADEIAVGELRARHMAAETLITQAVQIGHGVIGSVHIGDAQIGRAKIGIAEIDTLRLANGAATGVFSAFGGGATLGANQGGRFINIGVGNAVGEIMLVEATVTGGLSGSDCICQGRILRDEIDITGWRRLASVPSGAVGFAAPVATHDFPGAGGHSYALEVRVVTGSFSALGSIETTYMKVTGVRR